VMTVTNAVEKIIGEKNMSMIIEMFKAEGVAEGIVKGEIRATLKQRFRGVPQEIKDTIQSMTDLVALESLLVHAENCGSLDEFAEALK